MSNIEIVVLLVTGFAVGFINTIAGGATVISFTSLLILGMPPVAANATHRVAATIQTMVSSGVFIKRKLLDAGTGIRFGIPVTIGSIIGAWLSTYIGEVDFKIIAGVAMLIMLVAMIIKPNLWLDGKNSSIVTKPKKWHYPILFAVGFYGGFIYIGVGYFLLAAIVFTSGFDLLKSNALKVFVVMLYVPFTLIPFIVKGLINWQYAFILSIGQAAGAWIAARASVTFGSNFIRWFMMILTIILIADLFDIISLQSLLRYKR